MLTSTSSLRSDARGRVTQAIDGFGSITSYSYNIESRLVKVCQGAALPGCSGGQLRSFNYDKLGFELSETTPEKGTDDSNVPFSFDSLGNVRVRTEGYGTATAKTHTYTYDPAGRLALDTVAGTATPYLTNCYDGSAVNTNCPDGQPNYYGGASPKGKLTRRTSSNPLFRPVVGSATAALHIEQLDYSGQGGRLSLKYVTTPTGEFSGAAELWIYNSLGVLGQHNHPRSGASNLIESFNYHFGRIGSIGVAGTDYNGVATDPITLTAGYYPSGQLSSYTATRTAGGTLETDITADGVSRPARIKSVPSGFDTGTINYDAAGNLMSMGADSFTYDADLRLIGVNYGQGTACPSLASMNQCFAYDTNGNMTGVTGINSRALPVSGTTNRLSLTSPASALYDGRGNLTSINLPGFIGSETLVYDARNRQIEDLGPGVDWQYLYNGTDERVARITAGSAQQGVSRREAARYFDQAKGWNATVGCSARFSDVTCNDPDWGWIETFAAQGMTSGCGSGLYCPETTTDKQSMSVFLIRAKYGTGYVPRHARQASLSIWTAHPPMSRSLRRP